MRAPLLVLLLALTTAAAAADEAVGAHVRVLFEDPLLADYAARVATTADEALLEVAQLFGVEPPTVVLTIDHRTDVFNAFAPLLPRPAVALRPLFPLRGEVGFGARDPLLLLLLHELTHTVQLGYRALPAGVAPLPRIGLVGETLAPPPPLWFIEGLATWVESTGTPGGGRLQDARTLGLLDSLALEGSWPAFDAAGLASYGAWPGGQTRYLVGSGFVGHLIDGHGFETILATLRAFNAGGPLHDFAGAWRRAAGTELAEEWEDYRRVVTARAEGRAAERIEVERLSDSAGPTGTPALSPDGRRIAWTVWPPAIAVAELGPQGLAALRTVSVAGLPSSLDWLDGDTLVYTRIDRRPDSDLAELFALDLGSGRERRLSHGARAAIVRAGPNGCLWYLRDVVPQGSSLQRSCSLQPDGAPGEADTVWTAPPGQHLVGLDVSPGGRVALSLWRTGRVDLALLGPDGPMLLTDDPAHDIDPVWEDERTLLFSSDRSGRYELFAATLDREAFAERVPLTASIGGAFAPVGGGTGVFVALGGEGYDLARYRPSDPRIAAATAAAEVPLASTVTPPLAPPFTAEFRPYRSVDSLAPYGWLPSAAALELAPFRAALALDILGQDDLGEHSYALTVGADSALVGHLGGAYLAVRYGYRDAAAFAASARQAPLSAAVRLGVWPHRPHLAPMSETALGAEAELTVRLASDPVVQGRLQVGLVQLQSLAAFVPELRADLSVSRQFGDAFGYRTRGGRLTLSARSTAAAPGRSSGVWANGSLLLPEPFGVVGTAELALRVGWRQAPPVPLQLDPFAAVATLGYRRSVGLGWRVGDGRYALERVSIEARLRGWYDGAFGLGGDVGVWGDTLLWYAAPLSLGGTLGYSDRWWGSVGVRLGF